MAEINDVFSKIGTLSEKISNARIPSFDYSPIINEPMVSRVLVDEKSTFAYQMQKQTDQIIEKSNEQNKLLIEQNKQLSDTCSKLGELCEAKDQEAKEAREEAKRSRRYNFAMLIISIISMLVAVAAWILPNL